MYEPRFNRNDVVVVAFEVILAEYPEMEWVDLVGNGRFSMQTYVRTLYAGLIYRFTMMSLPEIAALMQRNNHSSVFDWVQKYSRVEKRIRQGLEDEMLVQCLMRRLARVCGKVEGAQALTLLREVALEDVPLYKV